MCLLHARTLELHLFGEELPQYAILSHCWGQEEVSFQEIDLFRIKTPLNLRKPAGLRKIELCWQCALRDGLLYIWIDTRCIIDKTSLAELSEAINSMFTWQQRARVGYAYLEDVPAGFDTLPDLGDGHTISDKEEMGLSTSAVATSP